MKRGQQPAQCVVVPPTVLHVHAGRLGKSRATRNDPDVVRLSSQASCVNERHSSLTKSSGVWWRPGLQHDDLDALLTELVGQGPAPGARAHDDDDVVVVEAVAGHANPPA